MILIDHWCFAVSPKHFEEQLDVLRPWASRCDVGHACNAADSHFKLGR